MNSEIKSKANSSQSLITIDDIRLDSIDKGVEQLAQLITDEFGNDPSKWNLLEVKELIEASLSDEVLRTLVDNLKEESKRGSRMVSISVVIKDVCDLLAMKATSMAKISLISVIPRGLIAMFRGESIPEPETVVRYLERFTLQTLASVLNAVGAQYMQSYAARQDFIPSLESETEMLNKALQKAILAMARKGYKMVTTK